MLLSLCAHYVWVLQFYLQTTRSWDFPKKNKNQTIVVIDSGIWREFESLNDKGIYICSQNHNNLCIIIIILLH